MSGPLETQHCSDRTREGPGGSVYFVYFVTLKQCAASLNARVKGTASRPSQLLRCRAVRIASLKHKGAGVGQQKVREGMSAFDPFLPLG